MKHRTGVRGSSRAGVTTTWDPKPDSMERLGARIVIMGDCWVVDGKPDRYHRMTYRGARTELAHRFVYAEVNDVTLGADDVIHHLCEVKGCVRPEHLHATTASDHKRIHDGTITAEESRTTPELTLQAAHG